VADGSYRGSLILHRARGGLMVVNRLPLDEYVQGVVPSEMPASWHPEALKSQAVAARSYALASRPRSDVYDNLPDTRSQVYTGASREQPESNAAVRATARQVLTYRGKPIVAFFFSTSGGRTENAENSFVDSGPRPYLVSVPDPYDRISPRHRSELRVSGREMARRLRGHYAGGLVGIRVTKRGVSPRIVRARIVGTKGSEPIDGGRLRTLLGLPDTWAYFHKVVSWGGRRHLAGFFEPQGSGRVTIERRSRGRWRRTRRRVETFTGDFSLRVRPGTYRARSGSITGPAVRVDR
jgi:stage II sporulation protein D